MGSWTQLFGNRGGKTPAPSDASSSPPAEDGETLLQSFLRAATGVPPTGVDKLAEYSAVREATAEAQLGFISELVDVLEERTDSLTQDFGKYINHALAQLWVELLVERKLPFTETHILRLLSAWSVVRHRPVVTAVGRYTDEHGWSDALRAAVLELEPSEDIHALQAKAQVFPPIPGDSWADTAVADLATLSEEERSAWETAFRFFYDRPPAFPVRSDWLEKLDEVGEAVGKASFARHAGSWLRQLSAPDEPVFGRAVAGGLTVAQEANARVLHALVVGLARFSADGAAAKTLQHVVKVSFQPVSGLGAFMPQLGYRAMDALAHFSKESIAELEGLPRRAQIYATQLRSRS